MLAVVTNVTSVVTPRAEILRPVHYVFEESYIDPQVPESLL